MRSVDENPFDVNEHTAMRIPLFFLAVTLLGSLTACDEPGARDEYADDVRGRVEEVEDQVRERRDELRERLRNAEDRIRDELEAIENDDAVSREELDELRQRLERSADRLQEEMQNTDRDFEASMQDLGRAIERIGDALQEDSDIEPVDHAKLRDLLPREIAGMERYDTDGSTSSALGIRTSKIEARYAGPPGEMSVAIVDLGSISGAAAVGLDLLDARVDREFDDGWERTTEIAGYPAFVQVDDRADRMKRVGIIHVDDRFLVVISAEGLEIEEDIVEEVADNISLRRLARLAR